MPVALPRGGKARPGRTDDLAFAVNENGNALANLCGDLRADRKRRRIASGKQQSRIALQPSIVVNPGVRNLPMSDVAEVHDRGRVVSLDRHALKQSSGFPCIVRADAPCGRPTKFNHAGGG